MMLVNKENITTFIPQKPPFVFIDELINASEDGFETRFTVTDNCVLCESDELKEVGFIENMAQTVAAGFSYLDKKMSDGETAPKIGFIGSVNRFKVLRKAKNGETLTTIITPQMSFENITLVIGEVKIGDELVSSCELKIAIVDELELS